MPFRQRTDNNISRLTSSLAGFGFQMFPVTETTCSKNTRIQCLTSPRGSLWLILHRCQNRAPNINGFRSFRGHPQFFLAACPANADLLTDTLVARAGIEALGSVEAAQEVVEHGTVLEFCDLLTSNLWPCVFLLHLFLHFLWRKAHQHDNREKEWSFD